MSCQIISCHWLHTKKSSSLHSVADSNEGFCCDRYPRPSVTVDAAIVAQPADGKAAQLLLIQRKNPPCKVGHRNAGTASRLHCCLCTMPGS